jgi:hypothetical protein
LNQFDDWEGVRVRLSQIASERIRKALSDSLTTVERNRELIRLQTPPALPPLSDHLCRRPLDVERLRSLYSRWGFRSLAAQLPAANSAQGELGL